MPANSPPTPVREPVKRATFWILASVTVLLSVNWVAAVARFQVNVPIWDQWDFFGPLFDGKGWWDLFNFQHGPPRLGPGLVIDSWVMSAFSWDVRIESLWIVSLLIISALLALRLKWTLSGRLSAWDASIPILILSLAQWGAVIGVPIASHSVFALLLLLAACNVWLLRSAALRLPITGILAVALTFSGFGLFGGAMLTLLLAVDFARSCIPFEKRVALPAASGLILAAAGWICFAHGYLFNPASEGYHFPHKPLFDYARFLALMFAHPLGWDSETTLGYVTGSFLLLCCAAVSGNALLGWIQRRGDHRRLTEIVVALTGSGFAFAAFAAVGRVHLGVTAGMASRYTTLLIPLWLGLLFWSTTKNPPALRRCALVLTWLIALIPLTTSLSSPVSEWPGTAGLSETGRRLLAASTHEKMAWVSAYLQSGDFREADRIAGRLIHPAGESTALAGKLSWLKARQLSLFKASSSPDAWQPWWPESRCVWLLAHDPEQDECWMADDAVLWIQSEREGFVNFKVTQIATGLPDDARLEFAHRKIYGSESKGFLNETISLPVNEGEQTIRLHSAAGSTPANPPQDNRRISYRLGKPWISDQPEGVRWKPSNPGTAATWTPAYRWRMVSGFHGWEHPEAFGWSDSSLKIAIQSTVPAYLNVLIEKRYQPVASGSVIILMDDHRIEISNLEDHPAFSLPVLASSTSLIIQIENSAGAVSPHAHEGKGDTRPLALKFRQLSMSTQAEFPVLGATRPVPPANTSQSVRSLP